MEWDTRINYYVGIEETYTAAGADACSLQTCEIVVVLVLLIYRFSKF